MTIDPSKIYSVSRPADGVDPRFREWERFNGAVPHAIAVVAKITDLDLWNRLSEVHCSRPPLKLPDNTWQVTASISSSYFARLSKEPFVQSLKMTQIIAPIEEPRGYVWW